MLEQRWDLRTFLARFVRDSSSCKQSLNRKSLTDCRWLVLLVERDLPDLGRRKFLRPCECLPVLGCTKVSGCKQRQDRSVDRILRPAKLRRTKSLLEIRALRAACTGGRKHFLADRIRRRFTLMSDRGQSIRCAFACASDHLAPVRVVG